jgi:hypothetical protein
MAPLQKVLSQIVEMVRPSWLGAFEEIQETLRSLVQAPMFEALRRIQEQIAAYAWPAISSQRMRDTIAGSLNLFAGAFRHTRDWASGFMTYQAKLRQQVNTMVGSWNWKLPDITEIFRSMTDNIVTIVRASEWPGWSSVTETIVKPAATHPTTAASTRSDPDRTVETSSRCPRTDQRPTTPPEALLTHAPSRICGSEVEVDR